MPSQPETTQPEHVIGWQGLTVSVPEDWTVGAVTGDYHEGYLRIDSPDCPRLEVRWGEAKGSVNLSRTVDRYLRTLQRDRKQPQPVTVDAEAKFISKRKVGKDEMQAFTWQGKQKGYGVAWYCGKCGRIVIAQVLGQPEEPGLEERAVRLLANLEDHPRDEWVTWALYDLHTQVPKQFEQSGVVLRAGLTELSFRREPERIVVSRWGMAQFARRGRPLEAWARQQLGKQFRAMRPVAAETLFRGHEAVRVVGEAQTPLGPWVRIGRHLAKREHADQLVAYIWHCEPTNRIYVVYGIVDLAHRELLEQIRDRTRCH